MEDTSKALRYFRNALKLLNEGCQSNEILPTDAMMSSDSSLTPFGCTALLSRPIRLGEDASAAALPVSPENPAILYSQAFLFEDPQSGSMTLERHSFFTAVLIYNTALALHQKGNKEGGHKAYLKALLFYGESMKLLRPVADDPETFRVIQEIIKNQADIYCKLNDVQNEHRVWEELAALAESRKLMGICYHKTSTAVSA